ncbi:hypothetical protein FRC15_000612 [Serendipita sp. 397]|nr:hypothetical protein FRC15_000612 [Serendipita sp. 397]
MASHMTYFSNHSQRFTPTTSAVPAAQQSSRSNPSQAASQGQAQPSAKLSNKILQSAASGSEEATIHPLRHTWVLWFQHRSPGSKISNYESGIKRVASFSSLESFWALYTHLNAPSLLSPTTDYLLFHSAVKRPVWEDPVNERGGKWIVRLKKGVADRMWEELVMAVIGDQFSPEGGKSATGDQAWNSDEICGCTMSVRSNEDILSVWHKTGSDEGVRLRIRDTIRRVLQLGPATVIEWKSNNDSMQDKSSFRTTPAVERTLSATDRA